MDFVTKEAKARVGVLSNLAAAERLTRKLYAERTVYKSMIDMIQKQYDERMEDTRAVLDQYPHAKFHFPEMRYDKEA